MEGVSNHERSTWMKLKIYLLRGFNIFFLITLLLFILLVLLFLFLLLFFLLLFFFLFLFLLKLLFDFLYLSFHFLLLLGSNSSFVNDWGAEFSVFDVTRTDEKEILFEG
jgi:hypothetical protein